MLTVLWQTKTKVSFPLEDKHVVNEHDGTQVKCRHVLHFNVTRDWFETNYWQQKNVTPKTAKKKKNSECRGLLGRVITFKAIKSCYELRSKSPMTKTFSRPDLLKCDECKECLLGRFISTV